MQFIDCFSPHPDHPFQPAVAHTIGVSFRQAGKVGLQFNRGTCLEAVVCLEDAFTIPEWLIAPGQIVNPGDPALRIERIIPDKHWKERIFPRNPVYIPLPCGGKVTETAEGQALSVFHGLEQDRPDSPLCPLFIIKNYDGGKSDIDPFAEIIRDLPRRQAIPTAATTASENVESGDSLWGLIGAILGLGLIGVALYFIVRLLVHDATLPLLFLLLGLIGASVEIVKAVGRAYGVRFGMGRKVIRRFLR